MKLYLRSTWRNMNTMTNTHMVNDPNLICLGYRSVASYKRPQGQQEVTRTRLVLRGTRALLPFIFWNENVKGELINMTRKLEKEKMWVSDRNRTRHLPNPGLASIHWATRPHGEWSHGVMGSIRVGDSDFFLNPTLVTYWSINLSHFRKGSKVLEYQTRQSLPKEIML